MRIRAVFFQSPVIKCRWATLIALLAFSFAALTARAQNLSYEGPTGIFISPTAYTSPSSETAHGLGMPSVGFHFLAAGPVMGNFSTASITEGFAKRFEVGVTGEFHNAGDHINEATRASDLSPIFNSDFNIVHGKAIVVEENAARTKWIPSIAVGGIYRFSDHMGDNLCNWLEETSCNVYLGGDGGDDELDNSFINNKVTNTDIYVVATKTITQISPKVPALFSAGVRGTNSVLRGIGGVAPAFEGRGFGALALVIPGPAKSTITPAVEVSQQPNQELVATEVMSSPGMEAKEELAMGDVPTSEAYSVRIAAPRLKLSIDAGVLHAAGVTYRGISRGRAYDLDARSRMFFGLSYKF